MHSQVGVGGVQALERGVGRKTRLAAVDAGFNGTGAKEAAAGLAAAMCAEARERRRHAAFRASAVLLLLANARHSGGEGGGGEGEGVRLLSMLPQGVLLSILELARPHDFAPLTGAAPSVHDSEGTALGAMLTKAARDPDATRTLAERLALRKKLVTDELLTLSASNADA